MIIKDLSKHQSPSKPIGALCPHCGGDLEIIQLKISTGKIIKVLTLGMIDIHFYRCDNCKRKFKLI